MKSLFLARMLFSRRVFIVAVLGLCPGLFAAAAKKAPVAKRADDAGAYKGAIILDAATGNVLFEDHADVGTPTSADEPA